MAKMFNIFLYFYSFLFIRKLFYRFHKFIYILSLHGMGILNYKNVKQSGEEYFLRNFFRNRKGNTGIVFDVGGNVGNYSKLIKRIAADAIIYSFEPHPKTFQKLAIAAKKYNFLAFNFGFSNEKASRMLYDYAEEDGSSHASFYKEAITGICEKHHRKEAISHPVNVIKIDDFVKNNHIDRIDLLKIDAEGEELMILQGAKEALAQDKIFVIHFEFNETHIASRVFFKDFFEILKNFNFYRLLPDGYVSIDNYNPIYCEIFAYQNIVAIKKDVNFEL